MNAIFYFKDGTILKVSGKKGIYNNKTNDMNLEKKLKWFKLKTKYLLII